jgi:hypothetical protein
LIRFDNIPLAFSSSRRRAVLNPFPPRFRKYVSIRIPEAGPLGETLFEASTRAIVPALFVNRPCGGCVESVVTFLTQRLEPCLLFVRAALVFAIP